MKNLLFFTCFLSVLLTFGACGSDDPIAENMPPEEETPDGNGGGNEDGGTVSPDVTNEDILIVFFSRAGENWQVGNVERGNTAIMADYIRDYTGGATFEIVPETPYPSDYATMLQVAQQELDTDARPAIRNPLENLEQYSVVFIGSPIWHGVPPKIMQTFYEAYPALAEKTIVPFGTHGGSGIGSCVRLIRQYFPDATLLDDYGISGSQIRDAASRGNVEDWLRRIGIPSSNNTNETAD